MTTLHGGRPPFCAFATVGLHPDHLPATARNSAEGKTLATAIAASHEIRGEVGAGTHIALNWIRDDAAGWFWHNGATGGYSAFAVFAPGKDFAVVVLTNTTPGEIIVSPSA